MNTITDVNLENVKQMESEYSDSTLNNVAKAVTLCKAIQWRTVHIIFNVEPKPSQRPRLSGNRIYVPGASKNTQYFSRFVLPTLGDLWIDKPCRVKLDLYIKTPPSFTKTQKMLAEMKLLRPWTHTGDIDNFDKTYLDSIQGNMKRGHKGIMFDDCLVYELDSKKYYSMRPRVEMTIIYMHKIPKGIMNVLKLQDHPRP